MLKSLLNRTIGRTDRAEYAINAYVDGNASEEEALFVSELVKSDPELAKDLSTQQALRELLGRIETPEATRSFAITPEMVQTAESKESSLGKLFDQFAPNQKLAWAPAVLAGIAALAVAVLTVGDLAGLVEQSGSRSSSDEVAVFADVDDSSIELDGSTFAAGAAVPASEGLAAEAPTTSEMDLAQRAPADSAELAPAPMATPELAKAEVDGDQIQTEEAHVAPEQLLPYDPAASGSPAVGGAVDNSTTESNVVHEGEIAAISESALPDDGDSDGMPLPVRQLQLALAIITALLAAGWLRLRSTRS